MPRNVFDDIRETLETLSSQLSETGEMAEREVSDLFGRTSVDLSETDDAFIVTADLPGFERDDIEVRVRDTTLHLRARHDSESEESEDEQYLRRERSRRSVSRTVRLPGGIDPDAAEATFNNGVLTIRLPKNDHEDGHRVEIL